MPFLATMSLFSFGGWSILLILCLGIISLLIFVDRLLAIRRIGADSQDFLQGVFTVLDKDNFTEATAICEEAPGPVAALVAESIIHRKSSQANLQHILAATAHAELGRLERRTVLLALFAQFAPTLGLIGTLIAAASYLTTIGLEAPLISAGTSWYALSQAIAITTTGLITSLMCYALHQILLHQIDRIALDIDSAIVAILIYWGDDHE